MPRNRKVISLKPTTYNLLKALKKKKQTWDAFILGIVKKSRAPISSETSVSMSEVQHDSPSVEPASSKEPEENYFNCTKLCKRERTCNRTCRNNLDEIIEEGCYVSKFPYEWTTPQGKTVRVCKMMWFPNGNPNDPEHPYPECVAKQKDIPIQLPKTRLPQDPQLCWTCYMMRKRARETKQKPSDPFKGEPKVDWGKSGGSPDLWKYGNE